MSDKKDKYDISEESAKAQADKLLEYYDTDYEESKLFVKIAYDSLVNHIRKGRVEVSIGEDGIKVVQNLINPIGKEKQITSFTYGEIKVSHRIGLDKAQGTNERQYLLLSMLSGEGIETISKMHGGDVSIADSLGTIFLLL